VCRTAPAQLAQRALTRRTGTSRRYLPSLLEKIKSSPEQRYLLLSALKEIISRHTIDIHSISVRVRTRKQTSATAHVLWRAA
jgi:hypothetical protein